MPAVATNEPLNCDLPPKSKLKALIVDAGILIKGLKIHHLAEKYFTVREVWDEVRDETARSGLQLLPIDIQIRIPTPESLQAVSEFAKKTGDYAVLSIPDMKLLALSYMIHKEMIGTENLRTKPVVAQHRSGKKKKAVVSGRGVSGKAKVEEDLCTSLMEKACIRDDAQESSKDGEEKEPNSLNQVSQNNTPSKVQDIDSESDDEGWITPKNVQQVKERQSNSSVAKDKDLESLQVACMTADYAIQNVLLQMGLSLVSPEGLRIRNVRNWVLRCHSCYHITRQMDKKFCPSCGNNTLLRTSTSTDMNGNVRYYLKKNKKFNLRGTKYSLPTPTGGRNPQEVLVLREDQREYERGLQRKKKELGNVFDPDYVPPWMVGSEKQSHAFGKLMIGYGRRNPNEVRKTGNKKKK